jgi:hypothetical protein
VTKAYYAPGRGVTYEVNNNWKVLHRLLEAEYDAGIRNRPVQKGQGVLQFLMAHPPLKTASATATEFSSGNSAVRLQYLGTPPPDAKSEIELRAPRNVNAAANLMVRVLLDEGLETLVLECLSSEYASAEFLNHLEPATFLELVEVAAGLTFGAKWRDRFGEQLKRAEKSR